MSFGELKLSESLLRAVRGAGYETATPIQTQAIPHLLAGRDLVGCAQTGTGKTAAFALPTLQLLAARAGRDSNAGRDSVARHGASRSDGPHSRRRIRCLVLAPTRELASQIGESFRTYGRHTNLRSTVIYGGVGQNPQVKALQHGVDIVVATPGRLLDLMNQGYVNLSHVEILILDEADQMFDMGFIHDLKRIVSRVPRERQTLLFSATMPPPIRDMAQQWLRNPVSVQVAPQSTTADRVAQSVYFVDRRNKPQLLAQCLKEHGVFRTLVFTRTKHGADKLVKHLIQDGIRSAAIHGNKSQNARRRALEDFKSGKLPVLVATDIAARGLDIDDVSHVFNYDLPMTPEIYVHRIGRTARAGAEGIAITLCDGDERSMLREIERITRQRVPVAKSEMAFTASPSETERPRRNAAHRPQASATAAGPAQNGNGQRRYSKPYGGKKRRSGSTGPNPYGAGRPKKFGDSSRFARSR
ncbi:MAG TPA: DEAD/DEAH box helicase [Pirellulaceae bacterium]|nr:DEAD/DEAH box helicase [Pirellulaceae bacterium]